MENVIEQKQEQEHITPDGAFDLKIGKTGFTFNLFFSPVTQDRIENKIRSLMTREVLSGKAFA